MVDDKKVQKDDVAETMNPLVFISHDTRDAELAEAFSALLKSVSAGVLKSFRTSDRKGNQGIEYGVEWYPEIIKNIQKASDVVCLLTERSVDRPWILFEAGMAKGKLETPILGVALGISLKDASSGPFAQFQNCGDDEDSLTKLVFQLVDRIPNSEPDEETIKFQVGKFKKNITEILKQTNNSIPSIKKAKGEVENGDNSSARLFEEIKVMFQDLPFRIEKNIRFDPIKKNKRRLHPMLLDKMMRIMNKNSKTEILIGLSFLKDGMPWLYDLGMETLNVLSSSDPFDVRQQALYDFEKVVEISTANPMMNDFMDSREEFMLYHKLPLKLVQSMNEYMKGSN